MLFDLDDTLNDRALSWEAFAFELAEASDGWLGSCDLAEVVRLIQQADRGGYRAKEELFPELVEILPWRHCPTVDALEKRWRLRFPSCMVAREHAITTLKELRAAGLKLGIVTNGRTDTQNAKIDAMGLRSLMDAALVSETFGVKKPDARIFHAALKQLGVETPHAVFVGDHAILDIRGASRAGLGTIWVRLGRTFPVDEIAPDFSVDDLVEIPAIVAAMA